MQCHLRLLQDSCPAGGDIAAEISTQLQQPVLHLGVVFVAFAGRPFCVSMVVVLLVLVVMVVLVVVVVG